MESAKSSSSFTILSGSLMEMATDIFAHGNTLKYLYINVLQCMTNKKQVILPKIVPNSNFYLHVTTHIGSSNSLNDEIIGRSMGEIAFVIVYILSTIGS